ncbi:molybdopterin synthase catalytic subunit [Campylobacter upsaliensis]|nr:molybdenum cofactor biosynthesis protein MoaE [Campylobacter upsaliensis]EAL4152504.1 molybdenum cofactor biosynthesis protein MoaE [Campylobacter upsaliensis]EKC3558178.1 molybdenum cofactor biosynthesis protein MoaE [Campylobacter upsaliensis]ELJ7405337.1 molybdenum cofactor biosynthesis protein MoaE [Campylobacter upsaliensis]
MFEIHKGALDISLIYTKWYESLRDKNCGAFLSFCGIVREEQSDEAKGIVEALSFEIYEPLLRVWFKGWEENYKKEGVKFFFAHSLGEVKIHQSSYLAGVLSKNRKLGLKLLNDFVEDFKKSAPIWKYDVIKGEKIYAQKRSYKLKGAGILA